MRRTLAAVCLVSAAHARDVARSAAVPHVYTVKHQDISSALLSEGWVTAAQGAAWAVRTGAITALCDASFPIPGKAPRFNRSGEAAFGAGSVELYLTAQVDAVLAAGGGGGGVPGGKEGVPSLDPVVTRAAMALLYTSLDGAMSLADPLLASLTSTLRQVETWAASQGDMVLPYVGNTVGEIVAGLYVAAQACEEGGGGAALSSTRSLARTLAAVRVLAAAAPPLHADLEACGRRVDLMATTNGHVLDPVGLGVQGCTGLSSLAEGTTSRLRALTREFDLVAVLARAMGERFASVAVSEREGGTTSLQTMDGFVGKTFLDTEPTHAAKGGSTGSGLFRKLEAAGKALQRALAACDIATAGGDVSTLSTLSSPEAIVEAVLAARSSPSPPLHGLPPGVTPASAGAGYLSLADVLDLASAKLSKQEASRPVMPHLSVTYTPPTTSLLYACRVGWEGGEGEEGGPPLTDSNALEALQGLLNTVQWVGRSLAMSLVQMAPNPGGAAGAGGPSSGGMPPGMGGGMPPGMGGGMPPGMNGGMPPGMGGMPPGMSGGMPPGMGGFPNGLPPGMPSDHPVARLMKMAVTPGEMPAEFPFPSLAGLLAPTGTMVGAVGGAAVQEREALPRGATGVALGMLIGGSGGGGEGSGVEQGTQRDEL